MIPYRTLGRTKLRVSAIGLGTWAFGSRVYGSVPPAEATKCIRFALDAGVNIFDSAPLYGRDGKVGIAEEVLGTALGSDRNSVLITTKFGRGRGKGTEFHSKSACASVDESLMRLKTDRIDVLFFHSPFHASEIEDDVWEGLSRLKAAGKVRWIGHSISNFQETRGMATQWLSQRRIDVIQVVLNLMNREAASDIKAWHEQGGGVLARETLANGFLSGAIREDTVFPSNSLNARYSRNELAERVQAAQAYRFLVRPPFNNLAQGATRWVLDQPSIDCVLAGCKTDKELKSLLVAASAASLSPEEQVRCRNMHSKDFPPA